MCAHGQVESCLVHDFSRLSLVGGSKRVATLLLPWCADVVHGLYYVFSVRPRVQPHSSPFSCQRPTRRQYPFVCQDSTCMLVLQGYLSDNDGTGLVVDMQGSWIHTTQVRIFFDRSFSSLPLCSLNRPGVVFALPCSHVYRRLVDIHEDRICFLPIPARRVRPIQDGLRTLSPLLGRTS